MSFSNTKSPSYVQTKGGVSVYDGSNAVSVPVGSNGQILSAQSSASSGVSWISTNLGTARYFPVVSGTISTGISSLTISSIPSGYKNIVVEIEGSSISTGGNANLYVQINSDTSSAATTYSTIQMTVRTAALFADYQIKTNRFEINGALQGTTSYTTGSYGSLQMLFVDYSSTSKYKTMSTRRNHQSSWTGATANRMAFTSSLWASTSAITSITLYMENNEFRNSSRYKVYVY